jgi:DNA-binding NtrC family response regulator
MPTSLRAGGDSASPEPLAELLALNAEFERRRDEWRGQLQAILKQYEDLESRRVSALARALRALDPRRERRHASAEGREVSLPALVEGYERSLIEWALAIAQGCQKDAAGLLGLRATTLHEKMKRFRLGRP